MEPAEIIITVIGSSTGLAVGSWLLKRLFGWTLAKFVTAVRDAVQPMLDEVRCELEKLRKQNHQEHEEIRTHLHEEQARRERLEGRIDGLHERDQEES